MGRRLFDCWDGDLVGRDSRHDTHVQCGRPRGDTRFRIDFLYDARDGVFRAGTGMAVSRGRRHRTSPPSPPRHACGLVDGGRHRHGVGRARQRSRRIRAAGHRLVLFLWMSPPNDAGSRSITHARRMPVRPSRDSRAGSLRDFAPGTCAAVVCAWHPLLVTVGDADRRPTVVFCRGPTHGRCVVARVLS